MAFVHRLPISRSEPRTSPSMTTSFPCQSTQRPCLFQPTLVRARWSRMQNLGTTPHFSRAVLNIFLPLVSSDPGHRRSSESPSSESTPTLSSPGTVDMGTKTGLRTSKSFALRELHDLPNDLGRSDAQLQLRVYLQEPTNTCRPRIVQSRLTAQSTFNETTRRAGRKGRKSNKREGERGSTGSPLVERVRLGRRELSDQVSDQSTDSYSVRRRAPSFGAPVSCSTPTKSSFRPLSLGEIDFIGSTRGARFPLGYIHHVRPTCSPRLRISLAVRRTGQSQFRPSDPTADGLRRHLISASG